MKPSVVIDCFPESVLRYRRGYAVVAVDVIRATTTIATVLARGRRCFPVSSLEAAGRIKARLVNPLCAGELAGIVPPGFEMNNSPAELDLRSDVRRALVVLSSSGTKLISLGRQCETLYVGCMRNFEGVARYVARRHQRIAVIGAGSRGTFREEDQMCCAWIAHRLLEAGFVSENAQTLELVRRWKIGDLQGVLASASADYLIRTGQGKDLDFVLSHVADLEDTCVSEGEEVVVAGSLPRPDTTLPASQDVPEYAQ